MRRARALEGTDPRAAALAWQQVGQEVVDLALWLPVFNLRTIDVVSTRVRNHQFHPYWGFLASQAWLQ